MFGVYKEGDYAAIRLSPKTVIEACRAFLDARNKRIHDEREQMIAAVMQQPHIRWPRFWQKHYPNRTEAIMLLKRSHDIFGSAWSDVELCGYMVAERVRDLLKVAHVANVAGERFMVLSERAVRDIGSYLEGEENGNDEEGKGADASASRGVAVGASDASYPGCVTGHPGP